MKISYLYITALIFFLISRWGFSQVSCTNPVPPSLISVLVEPETGFTEFRWTSSPSVNVAAYLIYIYHNESGIPRGDIIDTIWDANATNYTYESKISTYYSVSFIMSAFRIPNCTSSFSNVINTIFTNAAIDTCNKKINIRWNSYPSSPRRVISYSLLTWVNGGALTETANIGADQNSYTLTQFLSNSQYCFAIKAILEDGTYSTSNKVCISTRMQQPPDWINADYASVDGNNVINLSFTIDPASRINTYRLERQTENENTFTQIDQIVTAGRHVNQTDKLADPNKRNFYRLLAVNNCGNAIVSSNIENNIVSTISTEGNNINLKWNQYKNWRGDNSGYKVFIDTGNGFSEKANLQGTDTFYIINYSDLMYSVSENKLCFYIEAFEKNNPYNIQGETNSSRICTDIIERITVPNAFTPNNDLKNDLFKPFLSFTPSEYHLIISDRQSKVLFESRDFNEQWDGRFRGELVPEGVYIWFLKVGSPSGKNFTRTGTVTVLR